MQLSVSTHWNTYRHTSGEAMIEEILALGADGVELGYDLRVDMVEGVKNMVRRGAVKINSVHNFCPVPPGAHRGHPEIYTPASTDRLTREMAVTHMTSTIHFAAEVGAKVVVAHAGNVKMNRMSMELIDWCMRGQQYSPSYEKMKMKTMLARDKKAPEQLRFLRESIDRLLPVLEQHQIALAFENLPTWEAIPTEMEMEQLAREYNHPLIRSWFDFGHAHIRQYMGFINAERWCERLAPYCAGMHIHDVTPPVQDHVMPPLGRIPFEHFKWFAQQDLVRVIEPAPGADAQQVKEAIAYLRACWQDEPQNREAQTTEGNS